MNTAKKLSIRLEAVGGDKVRQEFKNIGSDGQKAFQRITQVITPANDNLKVLDNTAKAFNNTLKQAASLAGAYLGLRGLTSTFKSIVGVNAEFERLSGSLKTVTGSAKAAKEAFTLIEDFATSTPFQLDEIVDSFIRLYRLDQIWAARGDTFNAVFDSKLTVYDALSRTCKVGRSVPYIQGGIVRFVRDEPKSIPVALFGPRNIVKNSLSIQYIMPSEDTADSVCVQYFSDRTWKNSEITGSFEGSTSDKTATVELFGCTDKNQALREAIYMALANRYRRRIVTFSTELEGLIPSYGDLISITHDMPHWGSGGEILSKNDMTLTLSEPVEFTEGQNHYLALRTRTGSLSGPYRVRAGSLPNEVILQETPDIEIETGTNSERTHFAFGTQDKWGTLARVTGIKPRSGKVEITAAIEDSRVHTN